MSDRRAVAAAIVLAVEFAVVTSVARAQAPGAPSPAAVREAESHFRHGVELYKDEDLGGALVEFKRAYGLAPNYHVLFDLGQTYFQLQRYAEALDAFQRFLAQGESGITPEKRAAVEADVRALAERVGQVEVKVNLDGAFVAIDNEPVGTTPLPQALTVSVGHRKVTVTRAGLPSQDRFLDVAAGDRATVVVDLLPEGTAASPPALAFSSPATHVAMAPEGAPAAAPVPVPEAVPANDPDRTVQWVAWGFTSALGVATVVTGVLTLAAKGDLSTQLDMFPGNPEAIDEARDRTRAFGIVTDALLGATAVAGGVAIVLTVRHHPTSPSADVRVGPGDVRLQGRF
jgi:Tetratricopeptide repeat